MSRGRAAPNKVPRRNRLITADKKNRVNDEITARSVRLVDQEGTQLGVMDIDGALSAAEAAGLDLVEIAPGAEPPVCRIMDYGKFLFSQNKKRQAAKKKQKQIQVKEIKFRPGTDTGDYEIKVRNASRFLNQGDKVKITLRFRGREMAHQELGAKMLKRIEDDLAALGSVEQFPKLEGRQMVMVIAPKKS